MAIEEVWTSGESLKVPSFDFESSWTYVVHRDKFMVYLTQKLLRSKHYRLHYWIQSEQSNIRAGTEFSTEPII
jgi:hypothetical protein